MDLPPPPPPYPLFLFATHKSHTDIHVHKQTHTHGKITRKILRSSRLRRPAHILSPSFNYLSLSLTSLIDYLLFRGQTNTMRMTFYRNSGLQWLPEFRNISFTSTFIKLCLSWIFPLFVCISTSRGVTCITHSAPTHTQTYNTVHTHRHTHIQTYRPYSQMDVHIKHSILYIPQSPSACYSTMVALLSFEPLRCPLL